MMIIMMMMPASCNLRQINVYVYRQYCIHDISLRKEVIENLAENTPTEVNCL